jgi:23S rRNA (cytidine2498-2'-O)-methyltransferase
MSAHSPHAASYRSTTLIATARAESWKAALEEVRDVAGRPLDVTNLRPDILLLRLSKPFGEVAGEWRARPPVFIRHLVPVAVTAPLGGVTNPAEASEAILAGLGDLDGIASEDVLGVQVRSLADDLPFGRVQLAHHLGAELQLRPGAQVDLRRASVILSVLIENRSAKELVAHAGVSAASDNLSAWAGGERRFKRYESQVSRAEFKLLEALDVFGIDLTSCGSALDLGASPGGWSKVLADAGSNVLAVDPGELDPRLTERQEIRHFAGTVEDFLNAKAEDVFDVIVNDMRMDARRSARMQVLVAPLLRPSGTAIMTLKLGQRSPLAEVRSALDVLRRTYVIRHARQLFHNRSEVTVVLAC